MRDTLSRIREQLLRVYRIRPFDEVSAYIRSLPLGDRIIAGVLGGLVAFSGVVGIYGLERHFLVAEPAYGGTLTEGAVGSPRFVNPLLALSDSDRDLTTLVYAGLMGE